MQTFQIRPRFSTEVSRTPEEIMASLEKTLDDHPDQITGNLSRLHAVIGIPKEDHHYWSPQLRIDLEEQDFGTTINGIYGPSPEIWMAFMFLYFLFGFITLVVLMVGLTRNNMGMNSYILWAIPFTLGGILTLYLSAKTGQKLGREQMERIHKLVGQQLSA